MKNPADPNPSLLFAYSTQKQMSLWIQVKFPGGSTNGHKITCLWMQLGWHITKSLPCYIYTQYTKKLQLEGFQEECCCFFGRIAAKYDAVSTLSHYTTVNRLHRTLWKLEQALRLKLPGCFSWPQSVVDGTFSRGSAGSYWALLFWPFPHRTWRISSDSSLSPNGSLFDQECGWGVAIAGKS